MEIAMYEEKLCYSLEEAQDRIAKAIVSYAVNTNINISLQKLAGYRLLTIWENKPETTSP